jgi:ribosome-associated protein
VRKLAAYFADQEKREQDDRDLTSRSDLSKDRKQTENAFVELSRSLVECTAKQLARLELPESLLTVVLEARRIESPPARYRALRLVRRELRAGDADTIQAKFAQLNEPMRAATRSHLEHWIERLEHEGEVAINAFVDVHPSADRQQLRTLQRNVQKASDAARKKATAALSKRLGEWLAMK